VSAHHYDGSPCPESCPCASREVERLRAQLEAATRERDDLKAERDDLTRRLDGLLDERRLVALELGCGLQVPLPGRLADVAKHYVSQVRDGEARLTRERDEARAFAADRETLALELDAARETIQHGIELRQKAERERDDWAKDFGEKADRLLEVMRERDAARESEARMRAALEAAVREMERASNVGEVRFKTNALASGVHIGLSEALFTARAALSAPAPEPSERMMRVAEAMQEACFCIVDYGEGGREGVLQSLRAIDLRAIVAKVMS